MALTKNQALIFLSNLKKKTSNKSIKYYTIGTIRILLQKDIITVADILAEFPELDTP